MQTGRGINDLGMRAALILALLAALSACAGGGSRRPGTLRPGAIQSESIRQCMANLSSTGIAFDRLPDRSYGGGCTAMGAVKLLDIGVPTTNLGAMTCGLASSFSAWTRYAVGPAAHQILGSDLVRVNSFGTYSCRPIAGSNRLSEHGHANAVDVSSFDLADGRKISIKNDWNSSDPQVRQFLRVVRQSACRRFRTVLSPDYNAAHHDHLHFDMGGKGTYCR
jgi:hypothetical protein